MKEHYLKSTTNFITKYRKYSPDEIEKLQYGLEGIYLTLTKTIIILLTSYLLGVLKETLIILVLFNILRFTGFGFHAGGSFTCLVLSTILFSILPYLFITFEISFWIKFVIIIVCFLSLGLYAPADTVKRPLPNRKKRIVRKCCTLITASIYSVISILIYHDSVSNLLLIALIIETIMVHPITYKVFRQPYRNYKNYLAV